jgi:hypothetical protein
VPDQLLRIQLMQRGPNPIIPCSLMERHECTAMHQLLGLSQTCPGCYLVLAIEAQGASHRAYCTSAHSAVRALPSMEYHSVAHLLDLGAI